MSTMFLFVIDRTTTETFDGRILTYPCYSKCNVSCREVEREDACADRPALWKIWIDDPAKSYGAIDPKTQRLAITVVTVDNATVSAISCFRHDRA
jgi:hypothetical protein